jgi:hypothetical protein
MKLMDNSINFRQKNLVIKSLRYLGRHKKISQYCDEFGKGWTELSFDEANNLIRMLDKMPWQ